MEEITKLTLKLLEYLGGLWISYCESSLVQRYPWLYTFGAELKYEPHSSCLNVLAKMYGCGGLALAGCQTLTQLLSHSPCSTGQGGEIGKKKKLMG